MRTAVISPGSDEGRNRFGPKIGGRLFPFKGWGAGSPSNTVWPGLRPTCTPSFVLIRPTVWPQYTNVTGRKKSPFGHHRTTLPGYIFGTKACIDNRKNLLNSDASSTCPDNMVNFGLLTAEIRWRVWGTPANFNRFRVLAALLHGTPVVGVSEILRH